MKYAILDASFPITRQSSGVAALWLKWALRSCGVEPVAPESADVLLVTCVSTQQSGYLHKLKTKYRNRIVIAGGPGAYAPYSLGKHADIVCVGEGQIFVETLIRDGIDACRRLSNSWIDGENKVVVPCESFPWNCPPIQAEDGVFRVMCGRGCKRKCKFCQTGWAVKYREHPDPKALFDSIAKVKKASHRVAYLSNDLAAHSFSHLLPATEHGSYSLDQIKRIGVPSARQIRIGVEGVSERLRKNVGKPISSDDLVNATAWLNGNKKSVRWFMIAGLPHETDDDWMDLQDCVLRWKRKSERGVLGISFTAFCPQSATPYATESLSDAYWARYEKFTEWFFSGRGWDNRIKLMNPAEPPGRMRRAILDIGISESFLRDGGHVGPNSRVEYPYQKQKTKNATA